MTRRTRAFQPRDAGASLILTICFVTWIGAIGGGLAMRTTSSVNNRNTLELVRNREYAADGAIEKAISEVLGETCLSVPGVTTDTLNQIDIRVDWTNACGVVQSSDGTAVAQRNVVFSACEQPVPDAACAEDQIIIRAQVNFEQAAGAVTKTYVQSWSVNR